MTSLQGWAIIILLVSIVILLGIINASLTDIINNQNIVPLGS